MPRRISVAFYDFLIIYLTFGAPFGVYYFLTRRAEFNSKRLWLKTILNFLFWLPLACRFLRNGKRLKNSFGRFFAKASSSDSKIERKLRILQRRIEEVILEQEIKISLFELREIFERYAGLTLACQNENKTCQTAENEIFRIAGNNNSEIAEICLKRRNRKRLSRHQTQARRDFLNVFVEFFKSHSETEKLGKLTIEFAALLDDVSVQNALKEMLEQKAQTEEALSVKNARKDLWKPEASKLSPINSTSTRLKTLTAAAMTTNLRGED